MLSSEKQGSRFFSILLLGSLSITFGEVLAGTSPLWFIDPWALIVTFPLYTLHTLFYLNLAVRFKRYSLRHLYYWGMLFALYEAPITKVLWNGYLTEETPIFGKVLGIAIFEFTTLVFFWHSLFSFLIPILLYEWLTSRKDTGLSSLDRAFIQLHKKAYQSSRSQKLFILGLIVLVSPILPLNTSFNLLVDLGTLLGSVFFIVLFYRLASRNSSLSVDPLVFGDKGFKILTFFFVLLYLTLTPFILPQNFPTTWLPYFSLLLVILLILLLIFWKTPRVTEERGAEPHPSITSPIEGEKLVDTSVSSSTPFSLVNSRFIGYLLLLYTALLTLYDLLPSVGTLVAIIFLLVIPLVGLILFIYSLKSRRGTK